MQNNDYLVQSINKYHSFIWFPMNHQFNFCFNRVVYRILTPRLFYLSQIAISPFQRLYIHVAEAIHVDLTIKIPPNINCLSWWLGMWQVQGVSLELFEVFPQYCWTMITLTHFKMHFHIYTLPIVVNLKKNKKNIPVQEAFLV